MKKKGRRLLHRLCGVIAGAIAFTAFQAAGIAGNTDSLNSLNAGAAAVLDAEPEDTPENASDHSDSESTKKDSEKTESSDEDDSEKSNLVMANVKDAVNVRKEADEDSDKVGKLYNDCGGEILERRNGWTKLKSGNLVGWTKDDYLVFGKEAEEMAEDVGNLVATVQTDALRVRKEPAEDAGVYGLLSKNEEVEAIEVIDDDWVSVDYEGDVGYIAAEYAKVEFMIDSGETMEEIKIREKKEKEEKAKATKQRALEAAAEQAPLINENLGAVQAATAEDVLLAALIQCEAGTQPYEGQLAVGAVVMNRVRSGGYPNTISEVIYASGQFPPARNGAVERKIENGVKASCLQAAQEAIAGVSNVGTATHFRRAGNHDGIVIGSHVFW